MNTRKMLECVAVTFLAPICAAAVQAESTGRWRELEAVPEVMDYTGVVAVEDTDVYVSKGGGWTDYWHYSVRDDEWKAIAAIPDKRARPYQNLIWLGGDELFAFDHRSAVWRYSRAEDTWTRLADYPGTVFGGTDAVGTVEGGKRYIYVLTARSFMRYSVSDDEWKRLSGTPPHPSSLLWTKDGYIYGLHMTTGKNTRLWRFSLSGGSVEQRATAPVEFEQYNNGFVAGGTDGLYAIRGARHDADTRRGATPTSEFWRYSRERDEWSLDYPLPEAVGSKAALARAVDGMYLVIGGTPSSFYFLPVYD